MINDEATRSQTLIDVSK